MSAEQVRILSLHHRQPSLTVCLHSPSLLHVFRDRRASWPFSQKIAYPTRPTPHPLAQHWAWPMGHSDHKRPVNSPPCLSASHSHGTKCQPVPLHSSAGASVGSLSVPWRKASRQMVPTALLPPSATGYMLFKQAAVCTLWPSDFKPRCSIAQAEEERWKSQTADLCYVFTNLESHLPYAHCHANSGIWKQRQRAPPKASSASATGS